MTNVRCLTPVRMLFAAVLSTLALAACGSPSVVREARVAPHTETVGAPATSSTTALPEPTSTLRPTRAPEEPTATKPPTAIPTEARKSPTVTPTESPKPSPVPTEPSPAAATTTEPEPAPTGVPAPQVVSFSATPEVTQNVGDKLTIEWEALGERAELCPISGRGPVELRCQDVSLVGSSEFVTDEESMTYTGFGLRVTAGDSFTWATAQVNLQCQNLRPWFFADAPQRCPEEEPLESYAAGQYFQGGIMMWVEETDDFYVFYEGEDDYGFQTFDWVLEITLKPGASEDNRVGEEPPEGLLEPISGFGLVWRGEIEGVREDVRERLGWATESEFGFDTAYQCITPSHPGLWSCYLHGPRGEILYLHPDSTAQVRLLWEEQ